jgi:hypothetical protein
MTQCKRRVSYRPLATWPSNRKMWPGVPSDYSFIWQTDKCSLRPGITRDYSFVRQNRIQQTLTRDTKKFQLCMTTANSDLDTRRLEFFLWQTDNKKLLPGIPTNYSFIWQTDNRKLWPGTPQDYSFVWQTDTCNLWQGYHNIVILFTVALRPNAGRGLLILEVSRSHTTTHHSR